MRFGVLGDAKIAREKLRPAIINAGHEVISVGRRDPSQAVDPIWGDVAVESYDALLANDAVEAVYIPLPNHLHVPMAIKALEAGKPVLCEKPVALSLDALEQLSQATKRTGQYLYDGYMVRYHPQWRWLRDLNIGTRLHITAQFSYPPQPSGNIRNIAAWGGGPIWDIGCYCLLSGLQLFDGTPDLVSVTKTKDTILDVEQSAAATISFGPGRDGREQILQIACSAAMGLSQSLHMVGSDGWARLDVPFNAPPEATARFAHISHGKDHLLGSGQEVRFETCDQYQLMVEDFVLAVNEKRASDLSQSYHLTKILSQMVAA